MQQQNDTFNQIIAKLKSMSLGEQLIGGGAVLMFIASFMPWWSVSVGPISASKDGWGAPGSFWSLVAILISLALLAVVLVQNLTEIKMPDLPQNFTWGRVYGGAAGVIVVLMLLKFWRVEATPIGGVGWGFFIAVIAAVAIAAGGFKLFSEEKAGGGSKPA